MNTKNTNKVADSNVIELATRELRQLKENLQALPDVHLNKYELDASWDEIQTRVSKVSSLKTSTRAWLSFVACTTLVAMLTLLVGSWSQQDSMQNQVPIQAKTDSGYEDMQNTIDLKSLKQFNRELESRLRALPEQPRLVRANTMDTIARLEDQIALLDYRLDLQEQQPLSESDYHALWQQRAKSMNGLYQIKAAQVQRSQQASLYQQSGFQRIAYYE